MYFLCTICYVQTLPLLSTNARFAYGKLRAVSFEIILAEILAVGGQLMVYQRGQDLLQLEEQAFAGGVAVGVHVKGN